MSRLIIAVFFILHICLLLEIKASLSKKKVFKYKKGYDNSKKYLPLKTKLPRNKEQKLNNRKLEPTAKQSTVIQDILVESLKCYKSSKDFIFEILFLVQESYEDENMKSVVASLDAKFIKQFFGDLKDLYENVKIGVAKISSDEKHCTLCHVVHKIVDTPTLINEEKLSRLQPEVFNASKISSLYMKKAIEICTTDMRVGWEPAGAKLVGDESLQVIKTLIIFADEAPSERQVDSVSKGCFDIDSVLVQSSLTRSRTNALIFVPDAKVMSWKLFWDNTNRAHDNRYAHVISMPSDLKLGLPMFRSTSVLLDTLMCKNTNPLQTTDVIQRESGRKVKGFEERDHVYFANLEIEKDGLNCSKNTFKDYSVQILFSDYMSGPENLNSVMNAFINEIRHAPLFRSRDYKKVSVALMGYGGKGDNCQKHCKLLDPWSTGKAPKTGYNSVSIENLMDDRELPHYSDMLYCLSTPTPAIELSKKNIVVIIMFTASDTKNSPSLYPAGQEPADRRCEPLLADDFVRELADKYNAIPVFIPRGEYVNLWKHQIRHISSDALVYEADKSPNTLVLNEINRIIQRRICLLNERENGA